MPLTLTEDLLSDMGWSGGGAWKNFGHPLGDLTGISYHPLGSEKALPLV